MLFLGGGYVRRLRLGTGEVSGDAPGGWVLLCLPGSAEGLRWLLLSGIGKPGSGTGPIHQERMMRSRFSGPCPSDVKSAGHPEPGFPIPLSSSTAALCAAGETQKNPSAGSIPGHRPGSQPQPADIPTPEEEHPGSREVSISSE